MSLIELLDSMIQKTR